MFLFLSYLEYNIYVNIWKNISLLKRPIEIVEKSNG